jgi:superfamily II DNA or RNA helicase
VVEPLPAKIIEDAIVAEAPGLGADQADAVRALCSARHALCTLIAPAGFGKTTTVHAAATAASAVGRPVIGLAATNQAAGRPS